MSARKSLRAVLATSLAGSAVVLAAGSASAGSFTHQPFDSVDAPVATDVVGAGSDTTQIALYNAAVQWNADTAHDYKVATFEANPSGDDLPALLHNTVTNATQIRPKDSGAGIKALLETPEVDFARASRVPKAAEQSSLDMTAFPFAMDHVGVAVNASNAPASALTLTHAQILGIFKHTITNWSDINPSLGDHPINAYLPSSGGTHDFFLAQLNKYDVEGGGSGTLTNANLTFTDVQEHDPNVFVNHSNDQWGIAPFSIGRAALPSGVGKVAVLGGMDEKRAVYDVVRTSQVSDSKLQALFGPAGFLCSPEATKAIKDGGLAQLATAANGGVCGEGTKTDVPTASLVTSAQSLTTELSLAATSPAAKTAKLVATAGDADGTVSFYEGGTLLADGVLKSAGGYTFTVANATPGAHTYTAKFVPSATSIWTEDTAIASVTVKSPAPAKVVSTIKETFPAKVKKGKRATGTVTVKLSGSSAVPTGKVTVKKGAKTVGSGTLSGGKVKVKLRKLPTGLQKLTITWPGDAAGVASSKKFTIRVK